MLRELAQWEKWSPDYSHIPFSSDLCKVPCEHQRAPIWEDGAWVKRGRQHFKQKVQKLSGVVVHLGNLRHFSMAEIPSIWKRNGWRWSGKPKGCLVLKVFTYQSFKFLLLVMASPCGMFVRRVVEVLWRSSGLHNMKANLSCGKINCDTSVEAPGMVMQRRWGCKFRKVGLEMVEAIIELKVLRGVAWQNLMTEWIIGVRETGVNFQKSDLG